MLLMAKKPKGRPKGRRPTVVIQARVPPDLHAALERVAVKNERTRNAELVVALKKHLSEQGEWAPKEGK